MRIRILVADDDADIRKLVTFKMNQEGYDVTTAADGDEVLALATESAYDLMLLDWQMPGGRAWSCARCSGPARRTPGPRSSC